MRTLALDLGDSWTGVAISDPLGITARPYTTLAYDELIPRLQEIVAKEKVKHVVIGYPQTLRGTHSVQTEKILALKKVIEEKLEGIECSLIDERFTSKQAATLKKAHNKKEKLEQHAVAAAVILTSFLEHRYFESEDL